MFFLGRRRVFVGECNGQAVYYDQRTREDLAAPKSMLLNTEGARDTNSFILELVVFFLAKWKENFFLIKQIIFLFKQFNFIIAVID